MASSGPSCLSLGTFLFCSRVIILSVISGASILLPNELAYLCSITSRTLSTRSSSFTLTRVEEAPGRRTQILRCIGGDGASLDSWEKSTVVRREKGKRYREDDGGRGSDAASLGVVNWT